MRLLRYGLPGLEKPGLLDTQGHIRDLSDQIGDFTPDLLDPACLMRLAAIDAGTLPKVIDSPRLGAPVSGTKFIAVGRNCSDRAPVSSRPVIFMTDISRPHGPDDDVCTFPGSAKMDWWLELGVVIGRRASYVDRSRSFEYVSGYMVVHDLSERWFQYECRGTWCTGTAAANFGPVGPWLVTKDEIANVQNLDMWLNVNGKRMQVANTRTMTLGVAHLVHYVSQHMVLEPGDVVTANARPGVSMGNESPIYLNEGDVIEVGIERLGTQRNKVRYLDNTRADARNESQVARA